MPSEELYAAIRGPSAAARTGEEAKRLRLGVDAWELPQVGSPHLEKYPWEVATW